MVNVNRPMGPILFGIGALALPAYPADATAQDEPVVAEARDGPCRMTVTGNGQTFAIEVQGLRPSESLRIESASEGEVIRGEEEASADGSYVSLVSPLVAGKSSGTASFTVTGSRCSVKASFPWRE